MDSAKHIRIGTRGSKLALWQAHFVKKQLEAIGVSVHLEIISTKGDQIQHLSFDKIEGKGFFTKEIEDSLLRGDIDMAVHSMKDLPTESPEGLVISAVSYREDPSDMLLIHPDAFDQDQPFRFKQGALIGTSSARRKAQMRHYRPDIELKDIRGNVPTRINKLRAGDFDAILLAAAGVNRLEIDLSDLKTMVLSPQEFVPAPAQGVLAFQCHKEDLSTRRILKQIHQPEVAELTNVERKILQLNEGGCHSPLGAFCSRDATGNYHVWAAMATAWDQPVKMVRLSSSTRFELAEQVTNALKV